MYQRCTKIFEESPFALGLRSGFRHDLALNDLNNASVTITGIAAVREKMGALVTLHVGVWNLTHQSLERGDLFLGPARDILESSRYTSLEYLRERFSELLLRYSLHRAGHRNHFTAEVLSIATSEDLFHVRQRFSAARHEWHTVSTVGSSPLTGASRGQG